MKKIAALSILYAIFCSASAQEILDTVTVTANRAQSTLQMATRSIDVLSKTQIEETPAITANEVLESVASLDVRQRGPLNVQADISIRGGTFDQTLVLLNGIRMNDPQTGHHNMNLPINLSVISQIEVLEGGAARTYGPNAFAGAINFQTPTHGKNGGVLDITYGANNLRLANLTGAFNAGKWYTLLSGNISASDGYIHNTDFESFNIYGQSARKFSFGTLLISCGWTKKAFGAQDFYSSRYAEQFEKTQSIFGSAKLTGGKTWKYSVLAYWRQHNDQFELFRETNDFYRYDDGYFIKSLADTAKYVPGVFADWNYYQGHNYHRTRVSGAEGQLKRAWKNAGTTTFGFDYRNEQIISNNLGKPLAEPIAVPNERGNYTKSDARDNYAVYAEHVVNYKKWLLTLGALANYNSAFGNDFMPGIDLGYRILPNLVAFGSVDRSFRLPTYTDLYYNLGGAQGSSTLLPEYSLNYEVGTRYIKGDLMASASIFTRQGTNMIDWVQWSPDSLVAENITEVNMNGISVSGGISLKKQTNNWLQNVQLGYTFLTADQENNGLQSIYVFDYLQHKLTASLTHKLFLDELTVNWRLSYQDRNGSYVDYPTQQTVAYKPFCLLDVRLNYSLNNLRFYVEASNLFNVTYVDRGNVAQPGRWLTAGLTVRFGEP